MTFTLRLAFPLRAVRRPDPPPSTRRLAPGQAVRLEPGPGQQAVRVLSGRLWLTQSGDATDHFLAPGSHHRFAPRGRVVLSCEGAMPACVRWE